MSLDDKEISKCREAFEKAGFWPNEVMWEAWKRAWLGGMKSAILAGCKPAPELLEALQAILDYGWDDAGNGYREITVPDEVYQRADAAIKKARSQ